MFFINPIIDYFTSFINVFNQKKLSRTGFEPVALTVLRSCHNQLDHPDNLYLHQHLIYFLWLTSNHFKPHITTYQIF